MPFFTLAVSGHRRLDANTFEIRFPRPAEFNYLPGQKISFLDGQIRRDYTLLGPGDAPELLICVRHLPEGRFSPKLASAKIGDPFQITSPFGYFTFTPSPRRAVFIATGTGIAPFVAFVRSGVRRFYLLHGVRSAESLYYSEELQAAAHVYQPCISGQAPPVIDKWSVFSGRVGPCLEQLLSPGAYDFYLCGRREMIRDVVAIIDRQFEGAHVYTEPFF